MDNMIDLSVGNKHLKTAVLFLVFNRISPTRQVFEEIRKAKPERLYIAADGPRMNVPGEAEKVKEVRTFILENINWPCTVKTLFRDDNLGCKYAVSGAINWFFENEEMGIILEDDCLPSQTFFVFCEELLLKFFNDFRIGQISGYNALNEHDFNGYSYGFTKYAPIWGWATWKRAWYYYDSEIRSWPLVKTKKMYENFVFNNYEKKFRIHQFDKLFQGALDTWDYQWVYAKFCNSMTSIMPSVNLVQNIGFGEDSTHTKIVPDYSKRIRLNSIKSIVHNNMVLNDRMYENKYFNTFIKRNSRLLRLLNKWKNLQLLQKR